MNQQNWLKDKKAVESNELIKINANERYKNELSAKSVNESNKGTINILGTNRTLTIIPQDNFPSSPFILPDDQLPSRWQCHLCKKHAAQNMIRSVNQKEWYCSRECSDRDNDLYKCIKCGNFVGITYEYENNRVIKVKISGVYWDNKDHYCSSCSEKEREKRNGNRRFSTNNEQQPQQETSTSSNYSTGNYYSSANVEPESYQGGSKNYQTNSTSNSSEPELVLHKAASDNPQKELEQLNDFQSATDVEQTSTILANKETQQKQTNSEKIALSNPENKKANSSSAPLIIAGVAIVGGVILTGSMFIRKSKIKTVK